MFIAGALVPGVFGNNSVKSCSISVKTLKLSQLGSWTCKVKLADAPFFMEAVFTVTTDIRVSDVRLPRHLKPERYSVFLTPFLVEGNFTIEVRSPKLSRFIVKNEHKLENQTRQLTDVRIGGAKARRVCKKVKDYYWEVLLLSDSLS